jgi:beta-lactamase class A
MVAMTALKRRTAALACLAGALATGAVQANETPPPAWVAKMQTELGALAQRDGAARGSRAPRFGVYVRDLASGAYLSWKAEDRWYWASMVKLPVAIAVLRGVERGEWTLETQVAVRPGDYVDGAGPTASLPVGSPATVRWLLEQMMGVSDNTASDMLIDLVGLAEVNATLQSLVPEKSANAITTLADVRRSIWNQVVPGGGDRLKGRDLLALRALPSDADRLQHFARLVDVPAARLRAGALDRGYDAYFEGGANSGRLDAYGALLKALDEGRALAPATTRTLLALMERSTTGLHRIKAGLPPGVRFAHKTGTQRRRVCDGGIVRWTPTVATPVAAPVAGATPTAEPSRERRAIVVACTRDDPSLERAEATLAQVGLAVCRSGLFGVLGVPTSDSSRGPPADGTTAVFHLAGAAGTCPLHAVAERQAAVDEDGRRAPSPPAGAGLPRSGGGR